MSPRSYATERNAAKLKSFDRVCPKPLVVVASINGHPCRALLDSGSLSDFMSTTLADQLKVKYTVLDKPLPLQLACSGSRSKVKVRASANFQYQNIDEERMFNIANLDTYDLILGTPFLFQHQVVLGMNPAQVTIRSDKSQPIRGVQTVVLESCASEVRSNQIEIMRETLREYVLPICKDASETPLPPLRVHNHPIDLIDPNKAYESRQTRCP